MLKSKNGNGVTFIMLIAKRGSVEAIKALLASKKITSTMLKSKGFDGINFTMYIADSGSDEAIKALLASERVTSDILNNEDLTALVKKRNDIIHANSTTGDQAEISKNDILFLNLLLYNGLKNVI